MLAALDDAVLDGKRGPFPFWVALNLVNNYFFFAGQAVFLILYFLCMLACRVYKIGPRSFAALAGETLLGCAMGCVLLLPAGLSLLQNPRTIDPYNGYGLSGLRQRPAVRGHSLQRLPHARRPLFQGSVPGRYPQTHQHDGLSAAGGAGGRHRLLPGTPPPSLCLAAENLHPLRLCAGAQQRLLWPSIPATMPDGTTCRCWCSAGPLPT